MEEKDYYESIDSTKKYIDDFDVALFFIIENVVLVLIVKKKKTQDILEDSLSLTTTVMIDVYNPDCYGVYLAIISDSSLCPLAIHRTDRKDSVVKNNGKSSFLCISQTKISSIRRSIKNHFFLTSLIEKDYVLICFNVKKHFS